MRHRFASFVAFAAVAAGSLVAAASLSRQTPVARPATGSTATQAPAGRASVSKPEGPLTAEARYGRAVDAWDAGHYPAALADLIALMQSPAADEYRDRVALLSGELFTTIDVTADGRNPKIAPSGDFAVFEMGSGASVATRLVRVTPGGAQTVADLGGLAAAFDPTSTHVVYLRAARTPEWTAANQALDAATTTQERQPAQLLVDSLLGAGDLVVREIATGKEVVMQAPGLLKSAPQFSADGQGVLFIGAQAGDLSRSDIYIATESAAPVRITDQPGHKTGMVVDPRGAAVLYAVTATAPFRAAGAGNRGRGAGAAAPPAAGSAATPAAGSAAAPAAAPNAGVTPNPCGAGGGGRGGGGATPSFGVIDLRAKTTRIINGSGATQSADGSTVAWLARTNDVCALMTSATLANAPKTIRTAGRLDAPALSPDGTKVAYQLMNNVGSSTDWDIYVSDQSGTPRRITRDIQHDLLPRFLTGDLLLGLMGEARHRRSQLYDLVSGSRSRIFSNNTIRTISPEYVWLPSASGKRLIIQAERDGDTVSTERGIYVVDLARKVTVPEVVARLERQAAAENDLRQRMTAAFKPLDGLIRKTVALISPVRAYEYEKAQFDFDSKYISQPGNAKAIDYLARTYTSFGYTPEVQWFQARQGNAAGPGVRTANVVATLKGTENPELVYVVSSHFDSVQIGPGADDDTSGTVALLEAARALSKTPLPATVVFASFTGEEAGLLGSREFVRLAAERKWNIVGALNNDMIGWAGESARMDNTIRYSNAGIRDIQHGAAFLFTDLILYDAKYYKSTDAQAFYDGWGDIVGGIGSYPVLANPNYHQPTDLIETINFRQVAETSKVTAATLIYLASSPSRLKNVKAVKTTAGVQVTWQVSPEAGVKSYVVTYGPASDPMKNKLSVTGPKAMLPALPAGSAVAVKAVNSRGLEGWDWARAVVQ